MPRTPSDQPTDVEMQILQVLWELKFGTARAVHDQLSKHRDTNYSTTVKMLQIMREKGWVSCNDSVRPQVFKPMMTREKTGKRLIRDLVDKVYNGSVMSMAMHALSSGRASEAEIQEMRELLDRLEKK
jgi:predicted transcriptional regulator